METLNFSLNFVSKSDFSWFCQLTNDYYCHNSQRKNALFFICAFVNQESIINAVY